MSSINEQIEAFSLRIDDKIALVESQAVKNITSLTTNVTKKTSVRP